MISFTLFLILWTSVSIAQQPMSGNETASKKQKIQTDSINNSGSLWGFGGNNDGSLGDGTNKPKTLPIKLGDEYIWKMIVSGYNNTLAIRNDGTMWGAGANGHGELGIGSKTPSNKFVQIGNDNDWKTVVNYDFHTMAIKNDGTLWSWGSNSSGELGDSTINFNNIVLEPHSVEPKNWKDVKID